MLTIRNIVVIVFAILLLNGCAVKPSEAFKLSPDNLAEREMQTRFFSAKADSEILAASASVLQDMGYTLDESETKLGVLSASKVADATDGVQVTLFILAAALGGQPQAIDKDQKIRATLVTLPRQQNDGYSVRLTLQRIVWNTNGQVTRVETINSKDVYSDFFEKLSKSVFLEAQKI